MYIEIGVNDPLNEFILRKTITGFKYKPLLLMSDIVNVTWFPGKVNQDEVGIELCKRAMI